MNKRLRTALQLTLGVLLSAVLLYLTYRKRSFADLAADMAQADPLMVGLSGLLLLAVFWLRALRWKILIESAGYPVSTYHTTLSVTISYLVNAVTPKIGEVIRCTVLYRSDKVPVATSFGTVFTERIIDVLVLLGGIFVIFLMEADRLGGLFADMAGHLFGSWTSTQVIALAALLVALMAAGIGVLFWLKKKARENPGKPGLITKVYEFVSGMLYAIKSIFRLKKPGMFLLYTVLVWAALIAMNVLFLLALPETRDLSWYYAVLVLFIGGIGWAMPVPAGMGTTHYIIRALFVAFGLPATMGENVGLISNGATFLFTILWGVIAWILFLMIPRHRGEKGSEA